MDQDDRDVIIDNSLFDALQNIDIDRLSGKDLSEVLPFLTRLLISPTFIKRPQLLRLLYPYKKTNDIIEQFQAKGLEAYDSNFNLPITSFESASNIDKLKIVATEYLKLQEKARQLAFNHGPSSTKLLQSDLFDNRIYVEEVSYCLCLLLMRPMIHPLINILDMSEALLHIKYGATYITRLVANMPDRCLEVCQTLITYGERLDECANFNEISEQRAKTLRLLCLLNPSIAFTVRLTTLQMCKMPSLTIMITLDNLTEALERYENYCQSSQSTSQHVDVMEIDVPDHKPHSLESLEDSYDSATAFITGILLGSDENTRLWLAQYTKSAQQKRIDQSYYSVLTKFRSQILACINRLFARILLQSPTNPEKDDDSSQMSSIDSDPKEMNRMLIRATATLRFYCALRGIGSLKFNSEESDTLLRLVTCKLPVNQTSVNFATTGVCTLLVCSSLIGCQREEKRESDWLKWLIKESNYSDNRYSGHGRCSISELLLLIAIHFQNNQNSQIADLVCSTLGMQLQIKASVAKCKPLFVQEVFNDQMVAEHAVRVPVTKNLDDHIKEFLPVHCIHQLLESRSFSKHQVPIKDWIYRQICESRRPIHHILPNLIEAYVNSVIISSSVHGHCGTNTPLSELEIARVFRVHLYSVDRNAHDVNFGPSAQNDKKTFKRKRKAKEREISEGEVSSLDEPEIVDPEAAQVLLLYYLTLYEDVRLKKNSELTSTERSNLIKYSADLMVDIPVYFLLQTARYNQESYEVILPDLMKLVTSQYPQLCSIQHQLNIESYEPSHLEAQSLNRNVSKLNPADWLSSKLGTPKKVSKGNLMKQLSLGFEGMKEDSTYLTRVINSIHALPKEEIWPFVDLFIENWSKVLDLDKSCCPDSMKLVQATTRLWWRFNTIFPRKLWVMTVNSLRRQNFKASHNTKPIGYSWDELALDPLIVFRCDNRVFRSVDVLSIVLHILSGFLAASRRCLQDQINEQPGRQKDSRNSEELRTTLILAQTSAAIQILLESCIPTDEEQDALNKREMNCELTPSDQLLLDRLEASVNCICEHLHQVFIADTNLAKLVHFQTYPSELLAITSEKIPSMHICLDFIPELLSQPDLSKQVFVIELTSHLCEKYAITKSLNVAKLCFNVAFTLLQLLPSERRAVFFIPVLPALIRICQVFHILREDVEIILNQINQITLAHMASTSSRLSMGSAQPFEGLENYNWRAIKALMKNLSLHEALYLCIQKCLLDLIKMKENDKKTVCLQPQNSVYNTIFAYGNHVINPSRS